MPTLDLWAGVNPDLVDTLPFDPYLATENLPGSPPPVSPTKEVDVLLTLPTLVLGETVNDADDRTAADPKDTQAERFEPVSTPVADEASVPEVSGPPDVTAEPADPKGSQVERLATVPTPMADPQASVPDVPGQQDVSAELAAGLDGTPKTDGFNALDHQDIRVCAKGCLNVL